MENNKPIPVQRPGVMVTRSGERINPFTIEPFEIDKSQIDPKYKQYLLLLKYFDNNGEDRYDNRFEIITDRKEVYKFLKDNIDFYDPNESLVMTSETTLSNAITVVQFIKHLKDNEYVDMDDGFDILEYINETTSEKSMITQDSKQIVRDIHSLSYEDMLKACDELID